MLVTDRRVWQASRTLRRCCGEISRVSSTTSRGLCASKAFTNNEWSHRLISSDIERNLNSSTAVQHFSKSATRATHWGAFNTASGSACVPLNVKKIFRSVRLWASRRVVVNAASIGPISISYGVAEEYKWTVVSEGRVCEDRICGP